MSSDFGTKPVYLVQTIDESVNLIVRIFAKTRLHLEIMVDNDWLCHLANNPSFISLIKNLKINNIIDANLFYKFFEFFIIASKKNRLTKITQFIIY